MALALVVFGLVVLVLALVEGGAIVAFLGSLLGERIDRCPRCGRLGLTQLGVRHPTGCPEHHLFTHAHAFHHGLRHH